MRKKVHPEVQMEVLFLIHQKLPIGMEMADEDWNKACDMVYVEAVLETIKWKLENDVKLMTWDKHP